eukprot:TRINITY_DN6710_c0_g1_i2.p1 TRINITY_DN6710_c0_g1~~TRINITY_DN6710_c0_g1_i2.p1  ORF type:complete len:829 (+),score=144.48 TRINITY_DN6710_c0_g1_i2:44-2530(+)
MANRTDEQQIESSRKALFQQFLTRNIDGKVYGNIIQENWLQSSSCRLLININDFRKFDDQIADEMMKEPSGYLTAFEKALTSYMKAQPFPDKLVTEADEFYVGFEGSFGAYQVSPRGLITELLHHLVCVEGIVTKCSSVRPKLVRSAHYCETTKEMRYIYHQNEATTLLTHDDKGNAISFEFGSSLFRDTQTTVIQEMPERAPAGQLPRSVVVTLENDLVDRLKPGDRVRIYGIYKAMPKDLTENQTKAIFKTFIAANNLQFINREVEGPVLSGEDIGFIKQIASEEDVFDKLAMSLAPSIYGHNFIKKAVLLQLLGGVEKNLENGTHIRGDINIMMIGDPSTAKSQMLRFVLNIAPLAVSTSGRGSSGVGLTAAVVSDSETGERRLEAGAMVLADRGIVCIDEFDKMSVEDRVAIHEVMEQQTVTIAKAGIHASLNARCSVLAAANPIYGKYNRNKKPAENIALPDSLLSRFDLLFIVLDNLDAEHDRHIAEHVLSMHRYKDAKRSSALNTSVYNTMLVSNEDIDKADQKDSIYLKHNPSTIDSSIKLFSLSFLKKYILYAKSRVFPVLTEEATAAIADAFSSLRAGEIMKTLPITPRTLETLIRLSTAHAKCRLSNIITVDDVNIVLDIMKYALFHDTTAKDPTQPNQDNKEPEEKTSAGEDNVDEEMDAVVDASNTSNVVDKKKSKTSIAATKKGNTKSSNKDKSKGKKKKEPNEDVDNMDVVDQNVKTASKPKKQGPQDPKVANNKQNAKRKEYFQKMVAQSKREHRGGDVVPVQFIFEVVNRPNDLKKLPDNQPFEMIEIQQMLQEMCDQGKLPHYDGDNVYF